MPKTSPRTAVRLVLGIGAATAAAHIGNNFTTYLIGGLIDRFGFTPIQMGLWSMVELLAYAAAMFLVAPVVATLSPRFLMVAAGVLVVAGQAGSAATDSFLLLLAGRLATGLGFGLANTALNLAAGRTDHPARAISIGIACQTMLYTGFNIALPMIGARFGVGGMFAALAAVSAVFTLAAGLLPAGAGAHAAPDRTGEAAPIGRDGWRVLVAMSLFTFGSLAIWPFMERAAHAIAIPAVTYGRYQSLATLASALGNVALAALAPRLRRAWPVAIALLTCGTACAALTTVGSDAAFATALLLFNMSWFVTYPLILGIAYAVDPAGRLAVLSSAAWLLMMALGSLATGVIAQVLGNYRLVGPLGMAVCTCAIVAIWPLARRLDAARP